MPEICFKDLAPGAVTTFGRHVVDRDAMVAFAREFDAQPFHVSEETARGTLAGGLIASGWYTCCLQMRMLCDAWLLRSSSLGGPGVDELKWLRPVAAGDVLSVRQTILEGRPSGSRPDMGLVRLQLETLNGDGETVMQQVHWGMFGRRGAAATRRTMVPPAPVTGALGGAPAAAEPAYFRDFEEVGIGVVQHLGSHAFTTESIVAFARAFDPQPFHVDEAAGRAGPFGRLAASGWHTASAWMAALVRHRQGAARAAEAAGDPPPVFGVSPGFRALRWLRPVYPGDTLSFTAEAIDKRVSASRPGWGIVQSRNAAVNARGETVFEFIGSGFYARRERP